jgi:hypothetical protein
METPILDRPIPESSAPWPLSAPESYVLLHGPRAKSIEAFKRGCSSSSPVMCSRWRPASDRAASISSQSRPAFSTPAQTCRGASWPRNLCKPSGTSTGGPPSVPPGVIHRACSSAISRDPHGHSAHLSESLRTGPSCPLWWSVDSLNATTMRHRGHLEARDTRRPQPAERRGSSSSR